MAGRPRNSRRADRDSDSMEALKPLVVLILFGTILYGAYSVIQKSPTGADSTTASVMPDAPPFAQPVIEVPTGLTPSPGQVPAPITTTPSTQVVAAAPGGVTASGVARQAEPPPAGAPITAGQVTASVPTLPIAPPAQSAPLPAQGTAPVVAAAVAAATTPDPAHAQSSPTYLTAESAPPPADDSPATSSITATAGSTGERPDRYATLPTAAAGTVPPPQGNPSPAPAAAAVSSAFATAWADAHDKLAGGRYAEALAALSIWYDDPSLGLEESQRLEDLLGQLAGSVIYSQQDLLLAPHVVTVGETLPAIALPLGISWQLLRKINGIADPQALVPGEHLKVIRGPFDAVVSVSRRRLSLQLRGNYAGSFPVVVGRDFISRVGSWIPVSAGGGESLAGAQTSTVTSSEVAPRGSIPLADGLRIDAVDDPTGMSENPPSMSLVISARDFADLVDILGPGSKVLIRQ